MQVYVRLRSASREYEWRHGVVVRRDESDATTRVAVVQLEDGQLVEANEEQDVLMANTDAGAGTGGKRASLAEIDSLDALTHLHEASFVDYLKERYAVDQVYCRSGSLLIAVNPFKNISGMYDMPAYCARLEAMRQSEKKDDAQLPPHVFSMAESAYQSLRRRRRMSSEPKKNQTILVSGESGAGKTESTKFIMQYLAEVSTPVDDAENDTPSAPDLTKFLLSANPILESFGNARTLRNDNSSRFGKFVRMFFNEPNEGASTNQHLQMVRSTVETYLLERVRVVHQGLGERNFHVFYELLKGASAELRKDLLLTDLQAKDFQYVNVGQCYERSDRVSDAQQFARVLEAMQVIGFTPAEQSCIWKIVSALLHLGNAGFVPPRGHEDDDPANAPPCIPANTSASEFSSREHLAMAAQLLSIDEAELVTSLTVRTINVSGETYQVKLSQAQCSDTRDAAARSLYGWVFQYLVKRINDTSPDQPSATVEEEKGDQRPCISVLDIFGFEEFDVNQFEQFCINYANEKLQYQFIKDILESEQNAHIQEGVKWDPVDYQDNAQCLEMIEQKPSGIFSLLDEECLMPKGTDATFARKMYLQMKQHPSFLASSKDQVDFTFQVNHYAGQIKYLATGFCEKNKDQPSAELLNLLKATDDDDLRIMVKAFEESDIPVKTQQERPKIRRRSSVIGSVGIGSQFKQQLANLVEVVQQTQTHYIRCIKPNDQNTSGQFDLGKVARQLRYGGVLKAIEIMRQSYPVRMPHFEFQARYSVLVRKRRRDNSEVGSLVRQLSPVGAEVGKTRVFIRQEAFDELERKRDLLLTGSVTRIQAKWRSVEQRRRYRRTLAILLSIQLRWKAIYFRKCLIRTRHRAAALLQCQIRAWYSRRRLYQMEAVMVIQRAFRVWQSMKVKPLASTSPPSIVAPEGRDVDVGDVFPKSRNKVKEQEPTRWSTMSTDDWRSTAGDSESSWTSEHPSIQNSYSIPTPPPSMEPPASVGDQEMLLRALSELERLRLRAAAAEAALAQISGGRAALPTSAIPSYMDQLSSFPRKLTQSFPSFNVDPFGGTTLHTLVEHGSPEEVYSFLATLPSSVDLLNRPENQRGHTPLHVAVRRGCVDVVGIFFRPDVLPHVNINAADRDGNTALHIAAQLNDELADRLMELLLCFGADVNDTNYLKQTALHLCAMVQREGSVGAELVGKLLRYGADPTLADLLKRTPLHYAVDKGLDEVAIALVKGGADMNIPDGEGQRVVTHPKGTHLLRYLRATPSWIPDADIASCMICQEPFSFFFGRKCHCDRCGRVCCSECCPSSSNWNGRFCFDCKHYQHISM